MASKLPELNIGPLINTYRNNPELYFKERLGIDNLWDGEEAILQAVVVALRDKKKKIVVPSGHSLGKDFTCAGLVPYFLEVWGPCIVITTAPTDRQVQKIMWGEIANHYHRAKSKPIGDLLSQEIKIAPDWYAIGFTTKETGAAIGKFQGFHNPRVFVIASEAQAIDDNVYEQIDAIMTGEIGLLIEIGNPLRSTGQFAKDIKDKSNIVIELSCLDNPNYKERKALVPGLCSYEWVEAKRKAWGEDDPRWYGRVLGKVPKQSIDTIFSQAEVDAGIKRKVLYHERKTYKGEAVDVARFGDDETVIFGGTNGMVEHKDIYAGLSTTETASRAVIGINKIKGNFIVVDGDGLGAGTVDTLKDMDLKEIEIVEIHSAAKSSDDQYENLRAEMWFTARARLALGQASIPDDPLLVEELLSVRYFFNKKGKIQVESKDDLKDPTRLGRSPDRADAWIMLQYGFSIADPIKFKDKYDNASSGVDRGGVASSVYQGAGAMVA